MFFSRAPNRQVFRPFRADSVGETRTLRHGHPLLLRPHHSRRPTDICHRCGEKQRIDQVKHTAETRQPRPRILLTCISFNERFAQVADNARSGNK